VPAAAAKHSQSGQQAPAKAASLGRQPACVAELAVHLAALAERLKRLESQPKAFLPPTESEQRGLAP
jgi:hypothetical protein